MSHPALLTLHSGEIYLAEHNDDAFFVREGTLLVFAVTETKGGRYGKRRFLYEARCGEVIPSFCYTDVNHQRHRFLLAVQDYAVIRIIENGSTKKLRTAFLKKCVPEKAEEDFFEALSDSLRTARVVDEGFILRSEQQRRRNAGDAEQLIDMLHGGGKTEKHREKRHSDLPEALKTGRHCCRELSAANKAVLAAVALLSACSVVVFSLCLQNWLVPQPDSAAQSIFMSILLVVMFGAAIAGRGYLAGAVVSNAAQRLQKQVTERYFLMRLSLLRREKITKTAQSLLGSYRMYASLLTDSIAVVCGTLTGAAGLVCAFVLAPLPALFGAFWTAALITAYAFVLTTNERRREASVKASGEADALLYQFATKIMTLRISGAEERAVLEYLKHELVHVRAQASIRRSSGFFAAFFSVVPMAFTVVLLPLFRGELPFGCVGAMSVCAICAVSVANSLTLLGRRGKMLQKLQSATGEYRENISDDVQPDAGSDISIDNVTFAYESDMPPVLRDLSLNISAGEYLAITGESGCGKTTLFRLLLGFELPQQGEVRYADTSVSRLDLRALRRQIGVVIQDGKLMSGTIAQNIALTKPDATAEEITDAVRAAGLEEDIAAMPMGLQTLVSGDGETFSDGQRQKILIARALLPKPALLLLDEATSSLDNAAQRVVAETIASLPVTRIVIAHRLSTLSQCDRIITIKDGAVAEQGSFDDLMKQSGLFSELVHRQILY